MNWGYVAGFIDADGSMGITRRGNGRYEPHLAFINTNKLVLDEIRSFMGTVPKVGVNNRYSESNYKPHWRTAYKLQIGSKRDLRHVLLNVKEFLVIKKRNAELILNFLDIRDKKRDLMKKPKAQWGVAFTYDEEEEKIYKEICGLNIKRGKRREKYESN